MAREILSKNGGGGDRAGHSIFGGATNAERLFFDYFHVFHEQPVNSRSSAVFFSHSAHTVQHGGLAHNILFRPCAIAAYAYSMLLDVMSSSDFGASVSFLTAFHIQMQCVRARVRMALPSCSVAPKVHALVLSVFSF